MHLNDRLTKRMQMNKRSKWGEIATQREYQRLKNAKKNYLFQTPRKVN